MKDVEDLIKAGLILIIGVALLSGTFITTQVAKSFTDLGVFMTIMAIIVAFLSIIIPIIKKFLQ